MSFIYLIGINIFSFFSYGIDKLFARKKMFRISEKILLLLSIMGGSVGALCAMCFFHHKTKKIKFKAINIISLVIWGYLVITN